MYRVELGARVRRACRVEGMSTREGLAGVRVGPQKTVRKMLSFLGAPINPYGFRRTPCKLALDIVRLPAQPISLMVAS